MIFYNTKNLQILHLTTLKYVLDGIIKKIKIKN